MEINTLSTAFGSVILIAIGYISIRVNGSNRGFVVALLNGMIAYFYAWLCFLILFDSRYVDFENQLLNGEGVRAFGLTLLFLIGAVAAGAIAARERRGWGMAFVTAYDAIVFFRLADVYIGGIRLEGEALFRPLEPDGILPLIYYWSFLGFVLVLIFGHAIIWSLRRVRYSPEERQADLLRQQEAIEQELDELEFEAEPTI